MKKIDFHVHSKFSEHPSEWFLQRLGAAESYTEPDFIFKTAKERGMDFVTITDHNRIEGSLLLKNKYPDEVITGMEATTYFPEDGCKVHILLFGINEKQFQEIQRIRKNIYEFREYLKEEKIAHSVAHPIYSVNGKLSVDHLEKLILLFDVFEGRNGGRSKVHNDIWVEALKNLENSFFDELYRKYRIEPYSDDPWNKGFTGGSDDHAGIFIGRTFTMVDAISTDDVLNKIKEKKTIFEGRHNDFKSLTFTVYKIAYDFSKTKSYKVTNPLLERIVDNLFRRKSYSFFDKVKWKMNITKKQNDDIRGLVIKLAENLKRNNGKDIEEKLKIFYDDIADISDAFLRLTFNSFEHDLAKGNFVNLVKNISSSLTGIFLSVPFFSSFKHLNQDRNLINNFRNKLGKSSFKEKSILWFTDTINDLNGVSVTLEKLAWLSWQKNKNLHIVSSFEKGNEEKFPPNVINLSHIYQFKLPYYEQYMLKVPSILKSLQRLQEYEPDEIYVSTPGPIGLLGLLMAKIFNVKSVGVFHTDFTEQASKIVEDESLISLLDVYIKWFYNSFDEIAVPTVEYIHILKNRGFETDKLKIFKRGVDLKIFSPKPETGKQFIKKLFNLKEGINLLYVGRISKDKNLDFLLHVYMEILKERNNVNLLMVGDGPYKIEIENRVKDLERVFISGRIENKNLPYIYSGSDLFLFPSSSDTFGMAVLEAQACGLPAIVSDKGGPKDIIINGKSGFVAKANDMRDWIEKINFVIGLIKNNPLLYRNLKTNAIKNAEENYNWDLVIDGLFK